MAENNEGYGYIPLQGSKCDECGQAFPELKVPTSDRNAKEDSNVPEKKQKCNACGKKFITLVALLFHKRKHNAVNPMKCSNCNRQFLTANRLEAHKASHIAENCKRSLKCNDCDKHFLSAGELETHKAFHIAENDDSTMKYDWTDSILPRQKSAIDKSRTCKNLTTEFSSNDNDLFTQINGMRSKRSCKRRTCSCCNEETSNSARLRRQRKSHNGKNQFKSSSQQQAISNPHSYCLRNKKSLDKRERPFQCEICHKSYLTNQHLVQHEKIHWGVKSFSCNICKRKFVYKGALKIHKIVHTGLRPFTCDTCNQSFNRKFNLIRHLKTQHRRENELICNICKKPITNSCYVAGHHQKRKRNKKDGRIENGATETPTYNNGEASSTPVNSNNQLQNGQLLDLVSHQEVKDNELHCELEAIEPSGMTYICFECHAEFELPWQLFKHCDEMHPVQSTVN